MGERVTGVRVTPISGGRVDRGGGPCGRAVSAGRGAMGCAEVSAGGGGGGGGAGGRLVPGSVDDAVVAGAVGSADVGVSSVVPGLRRMRRTAATTSAAAAAVAASHTVNAFLRRYHGGGSGSKYQVSASNASNAPLRAGSPNSSGGAGSGCAPPSDTSSSPGASARSPIERSKSPEASRSATHRCYPWHLRIRVANSR